MKGKRTVRVPASTSNLGPGFDALSLALEIYLTVGVDGGSESASHQVASSGVDAEKMPSGPDNLILKVLNLVAKHRKRPLEPTRLRVQNEIPLARGLGSSAAAILAGISCYEMIAADELTTEEVLRYAQEFEPHPDNLSASLMGGLTVSAIAASGYPVVSKIAVREGLTPVLVIPDFELATDKARGVLPESYTRSDLVFNIQRSALVVAAMMDGQWDLLSEAMRDRVHQPYRGILIPGLEQVLAIRQEGLSGIALSGAGPTVLALAQPGCEEDVGRTVQEVFMNHGVAATFEVSRFDTIGRCFLE
jgi:homoserine kinase